MECQPLLEVCDGLEKYLEVSLAAGDRLAVVTAVDNVIDQSIGDGTQGAWRPQNR